MASVRTFSRSFAKYHSLLSCIPVDALGKGLHRLMFMTVIFQNESWLVVLKPSLWLTVPSRLGERDERPCLGKALERELGKRLFPVHRLDFEVAGLVLFALTSEAHRLANGWFEQGQVGKLYQGLARGPVLAEFKTHQTWNSRLVRGKKRTFAAAHGQEALTEAQWVKTLSQDIELWELWPRTGRPHQLRFEMATHGFPLLGDKLYGGPPWLGRGVALAAVALDFSAINETNRCGLPDRLDQARDWSAELSP